MTHKGFDRWMDRHTYTCTGMTPLLQLLTWKCKCKCYMNQNSQKSFLPFPAFHKIPCGDFSIMAFEHNLISDLKWPIPLLDEITNQTNPILGIIPSRPKCTRLVKSFAHYDHRMKKEDTRIYTNHCQPLQKFTPLSQGGYKNSDLNVQNFWPVLYCVIGNFRKSI